MNLEIMMTMEGMLLVALVIAAVGAVVTNLFRNADSPYLITISGTRTEHITYGAVMWLVATGIGIATLLIVSALISPMVGLALFFGVEAVVLDILMHRTQYVRVSSRVEYARVRVTSPFNS